MLPKCIAAQYARVCMEIRHEYYTSLCWLLQNTNFVHHFVETLNSITIHSVKQVQILDNQMNLSFIWSSQHSNDKGYIQDNWCTTISLVYAHSNFLPISNSLQGTKHLWLTLILQVLNGVTLPRSKCKKWPQQMCNLKQWLILCLLLIQHGSHRRQHTYLWCHISRTQSILNIQFTVHFQPFGI